MKFEHAYTVVGTENIRESIKIVSNKHSEQHAFKLIATKLNYHMLFSFTKLGTNNKQYPTIFG